MGMVAECNGKTLPPSNTPIETPWGDYEVSATPAKTLGDSINSITLAGKLGDIGIQGIWQVLLYGVCT